MKNIFCYFGWHDKQVEQKFYPSITATQIKKVEVIITCRRCEWKVVDRWFDYEIDLLPKKAHIRIQHSDVQKLNQEANT